MTALLKNTAYIIQQYIRKIDSVGVNELDAPCNLLVRNGGDEFVLILSEASSPENAASI